MMRNFAATITAALTALIGVGGLLEGAKIRLSSGTPEGEPEDLTMDSFPLAAYTGNADTVIANWAIGSTSEGDPIAYGDIVNLAPADAVGLPVYIRSVLIFKDAAPDVPIAYSILDTPVKVAFADQPVHALPIYSLGDPDLDSEVFGS